MKFLRTHFSTEHLEAVSEELFKKEVRNFPYLYDKGNKTKKIGKRTHCLRFIKYYFARDLGFRIQDSSFKIQKEKYENAF